MLGFNNAIDWANSHTLLSIKMTDALDASISIDQVNRIAFGDRFGWALWNASSARDAFFSNFHRHGDFLLLRANITEYTYYTQLLCIDY